MSLKNKKNRKNEANNMELEKQANMELERQAILEIKRDAARGRERSKTMGTMGWLVFFVQFYLCIYFYYKRD